MKKLNYLLALAAATPSPAAAQAHAPSTREMIAALPVEDMCSAEGALGYRFGATDGPPKLLDVPGVADMDLHPRFAPFDRGGIDSTKWSDRIYAVIYTTHIPDDAAALATMEQIAQRFEQLGWSVERGPDEDASEPSTLSDLASGVEEIRLYPPPGAGGVERADSVRIDLTRFLDEVRLACSSTPFYELHVGEAFGNLPQGTPKPVPPVLALPARPDPAICSDPIRRRELLASRPGDNALVRYAIRRGKFGERLVTWKMDRLKKSGKLPEGRAMELVAAGFSDPRARKGVEANRSLVRDLLSVVGAIAADDGNDEAASCAHLLQLIAITENAGNAVGPQWAAIDAAVEKEAARLGVSLD